MSTSTTHRVARLHGIGDLRVERIPAPVPAPGELLVRIEANGVCATDARKLRVGVNDGVYPFNPGHEWVGRIEEVGAQVAGWAEGDRLYGDTYGGYAELTTIPVDPGPWSCGPTELPEGLPVDRAVFLEPLADCLHAVHDQAAVRSGQRVAVVAAGSMGLQVVAVAARAGAEVFAVEPRADRRDRAIALGAAGAFDPDGWVDRMQATGGAAAVFVCAGDPELVGPAIAACATGGRVVLFAGFGDRPVVPVDLNDVHYREIVIVGSEWIGAPPHQRRERYAQAAELLISGELALESLVTARCSFEDLEDALAGRAAFRDLKTVFVPHGEGA